MGRVRTLIVVAGFALLGTACGDDAVGTGNLLAKWELPSVVDCTKWQIATVEAKVTRDTETFRESMKCEGTRRTGEILLSGLTPGGWKLTVAGLDSAGAPRYGAESKGTVSVPDGGTVESETLGLLLSKASLVVDWTLPGGGKCATANVDMVEVKVDESLGAWSEKADPVDCDNLFDDPNDATKKVSGVMLSDLDAKSFEGVKVIITATGYDTKGAVVSTGSVADVALRPGDSLSKVVDLK